MDLLALRVREADTRWVVAWSQALDSGELAQADRFRRSEDRICYIAAHALLRTALGAATGRPPASLVFGRGLFGKPFLPAAPALHFSLTHTKGLTAVALHTSPVGCDAEPADRRVEEATFSIMAEEERVWLLGLPTAIVRQQAFIRLWVIKEAYVKALGLGLSLDPASYAFDLTGSEVILRRAPAGYADTTMWHFFAKDFGAIPAAVDADPCTHRHGPEKPGHDERASRATDADITHTVGLAVQGSLDLPDGCLLREMSAEAVAAAASHGPPLQIRKRA